MPTQPCRYAGRLDISPDASQPLYDLGARFYQPALGVFTQLDSVAGSATDPVRLNRYLYTEANPATLIDPSGHYAMERPDSQSPWDVQTTKGPVKYVHYQTHQGCGGQGQPECPANIPQSTGTWVPSPGELYVDALLALTTGPGLVQAAVKTPSAIADAWSWFRAAGWSGLCIYACPTAVEAGDQLVQIAEGGSGRSSVSEIASAQLRLELHAGEDAIRWLHEGGDLRSSRLSMSEGAHDYQSSAIAARSDVASGTALAPSLPYLSPTGEVRQVRFDGLDGTTLIDRKLSVVTTAKTMNQAVRQSQALAQNGLQAIWEVQNSLQASRANDMFQRLGITNISVQVVPPGVIR